MSQEKNITKGIVFNFEVLGYIKYYVENILCGIINRFYKITALQRSQEDILRHCITKTQDLYILFKCQGTKRSN